MLEQVVGWLRGAIRVWGRCGHRQLHWGEGKSHCPECGEGLVASWVILKCSGCNVRRTARSCFGQLSSLERYCRDCGCQETYLFQLNPALGVYHPFAWLVWEAESDYLTRQEGGPLAVGALHCSVSGMAQAEARVRPETKVWPVTRVWIDPTPQAQAAAAPAQPYSQTGPPKALPGLLWQTG